MQTLLSNLRAAAAATLALALVCCGLYPLAVTALAQLAFPAQANGSLIRDGHGVVRGSALLGQRFTGTGYFHTRPSAAGDGYDARQSGGSNLGPTSRQLRDTLAARIVVFRQENELFATNPVPADAVTASGSGLDPHISPATARLQIARVAAARRLPPETVAVLVTCAIESPQWGFLGDPRVNVLRLNLALDGLSQSEQKE